MDNERKGKGVGGWGGGVGTIPPHPTATGEEKKLPRKALLGPIGAFQAKPPFAKPPLERGLKFSDTFRIVFRIF